MLFIGLLLSVSVCGRGPFGGSGGGPFSDAGYAGDKITRVDVRSGERIDGLDQLVSKILSEENSTRSC